MPSESARGEVDRLVDDLDTNDRLRAFVDTLPFLIAQIDPFGRATYANRAWHTYTGLATGELLSALEPDDAERLPWSIGSPSADRQRVDVRIRNADNVLRWFALDATPVVAADGSLVRWIVTGTDIDEHVRTAEAYARDHRVAQSFQAAALSLQLPSLPSFRFEAIYEAGQSEALVGGDWYDAFLVDDGRCVISIGDVVGSGLEAAIAMINVRQTIRGVAQIHPDPALMLQAADRTVRLQYPDRFVTAFAAVLDPITKQGAYANAGHPPALVREPNGVVVALHESTLPLGMIAESSIAVAHFSFDAGCSLLLYTDGLVESDRDIVAGLAQLRAAFASEPPGDGAITRIYERTLARASSDDVAMLLVSSEAVGDLRRWRFDPFWRDAVQRVRGELLGAVGSAAFDSVRLLEVEIVFAEVLSNLLRYVPGTVDVFLERNAYNVVLHVLDKGPGFQFNPRLPSDLMSESGRGLFLIASLSTQFSVERRPGGGSHARIVFAHQQERLDSDDQR